MKRLFILLCIVSLGFAFFISARSSVSVQELPTLSVDDYVPNEVLVRFKEGTADASIKTAISSVQANVITFTKQTILAADWNSVSRSQLSFLNDPKLLHIKVPEEIGIEKAISILKQDPLVDYAEPNARTHFFTNDEHYSKLWGLNNTGQTGGTSDADIDAPEAWDVFTGSSDITVAVIDSGISYNHEDLDGNIWTNSGEYGGGKETDTVDNDGNGYTDDWHGWDFYSGDNDPDDYYYPVFHGTHVAGIIGALGNNEAGVVGVCWSVKMMPLVATNAAECTSATYYAADNGARVISASWGFSSYNESLYNAIQYARSKGVLFVAAAGNNGNLDNDSYPLYPASYNLDNIVAVAATDHNDNITSYSHYGRTSVDLGAPGGSSGTASIYSTMPYDSYQYMSGTSMATPYVTGASALALGKCPDLTYSQLKSRILDKTDYDSYLYNKCVSNGRMNAYNLVYDSAAPNGTPDGLSCTWYSWKSVCIGWTDNSSNEIGFSIQRKKSGEADFSGIQSVNANSGYYTDTSINGGTIYYKVKAYNMAGDVTSNSTSTTVPAGVPSAPSDLTAEDPTLVHHVALSWQDNATNEQAFVVQRRLSGGGQWTTVATIDVDFYSQYPTMSWTDTGVNQGNYYYRVKATNPNGSSSYSNELYVEVEGD